MSHFVSISSPQSELAAATAAESAVVATTVDAANVAREAAAATAAAATAPPGGGCTAGEQSEVAAAVGVEAWGVALARAKGLDADGVAALTQRSRGGGGWSGSGGGGGGESSGGRGGGSRSGSGFGSDDIDLEADDATLLAAAADALNAACTSASRLRAAALAHAALDTDGRADHAGMYTSGQLSSDTNGRPVGDGGDSGGGDRAATRAWRADMCHGEALFLRAQCHRLQGNHAAAVRDSAGRLHPEP